MGNFYITVMECVGQNVIKPRERTSSKLKHKVRFLKKTSKGH